MPWTYSCLLLLAASGRDRVSPLLCLLVSGRALPSGRELEAYIHAAGFLKSVKILLLTNLFRFAFAYHSILVKVLRSYYISYKSYTRYVHFVLSYLLMLVTIWYILKQESMAIALILSKYILFQS